MAGQFWRFAGFNYLQYLNINGQHLRNCLKESYRASAKARSETFTTNFTFYANGKELNTKTITSETLQQIAQVKK
eukprot:gene6177-7691_t